MLLRSITFWIHISCAEYIDKTARFSIILNSSLEKVQHSDAGCTTICHFYIATADNNNNKMYGVRHTNRNIKYRNRV